MQKVYLAKSLYQLANMQFQTYQTAASLAISIVDMSTWQGKKDLNKAGTIVANDQTLKAKKVFSLVGTAKKFYIKMENEKNGPWMLVIGLIFGIGGVIGVIYWIKKNIAS